MKRTTKTNDGITAIYVRRSVSDKDKGNNSLSISAQKEECIRFVGECDYRIYCDDGKSGKDVMHRPAFMQMMSDAREGLISRIIVKKYDRFSRNMREYLNITDELDRYGVTVYSLSEPFNTETKEGRMMRNNLLNFAEFERETIAARVADAFQTKAARHRYKRPVRLCNMFPMKHYRRPNSCMGKAPPNGTDYHTNRRTHTHH